MKFNSSCLTRCRRLPVEDSRVDFQFCINFHATRSLDAFQLLCSRIIVRKTLQNRRNHTGHMLWTDFSRERFLSLLHKFAYTCLRFARNICIDLNPKCTANSSDFRITLLNDEQILGAESLPFRNWFPEAGRGGKFCQATIEACLWWKHFHLISIQNIFYVRRMLDVLPTTGFCWPKQNDNIEEIIFLPFANVLKGEIRSWDQA